MKKRALLAVTLVFSVARMLSAAPQERPNILWLTSEDNAADWLGCYGNPHAETPNLDRLAGEGFQYMHAYANAPACAPSRSSLITGIMAVSMGTHPQRCRYNIPHDQIAYYPDQLNAAGYYTANDKKTDYNIGGRKDADCWDQLGAINWDTLKARQPFFQVINDGASHESKIYRDFFDINETEHDPADTTLRKYHPDVPEIRKTNARYFDAIHNLDNDIGAVLAKLDELGLADNTIVIYNSDHGGVLPRSKRFLFRNSLQCPLIIRIPERYKALWPADKPGSKIDRLVSFVDLPKTWLSLTGSTVPETMQGRVFLGPQTEAEPRYHFAFRGRMEDRVDNARAVCDKRFLYICNYMPYVPWMQHYYHIWREEATKAWEQEVRAGRANAAQSRLFSPKDREELYDMQGDSDCVENLIDQPEYSEIAAKMRKNLRQQQETLYDAGLLPELDMVRMAKKNNTTLYEMARNPDLYDIPALLDAADLALVKDPANLPELHAMLNRPEMGQRYWGLIGCFLLNDSQAAHQVLADESHEIRAMAAWLLIRTGEKEKGFACLTDLLNQKSYATISILNIVDWMGEDARALMPVIRQLDLKNVYPTQAAFVRDLLIEKFGE